jgi:single-stranded-DNA-specific exonuclease
MRWTIKPKPSEDKIKHLAQPYNGKILWLPINTAWIETLKTLRTSFVLLRPLARSYLMKIWIKAVAAIEAAIENQEKHYGFGDYDVDGTTAVSLVSSYLNHIIL